MTTQEVLLRISDEMMTLQASLQERIELSDERNGNISEKLALAAEQNGIMKAHVLLLKTLNSL